MHQLDRLAHQNVMIIIFLMIVGPDVSVSKIISFKVLSMTQRHGQRDRKNQWRT